MFSLYLRRRVRWLLGAVLNSFARVFNVLAKTVGRIAADSDNNQGGGDDEQNNDAFNQGDHICVKFAIAWLLIDLAGGAPIFLDGP